MAERKRKKVEYRMDKVVHVGQMLRAFMKDRGLNQAEVARRTFMTPQALSGMLNRPSMQVEVLMRLSEVLDHDFFADLSAELLTRKLMIVDPLDTSKKPDRLIELSVKATPEQLDRVTRFLHVFDRAKSG